MTAQVLFAHDFMDEACKTGPIVVGQWVRESEMKREIWISNRQFLKIVLIVDLLFRAGSIPKTDSTVRLFRLEQMGKVGAERSHTGTAANVDHFSLCRFDME